MLLITVILLILTTVVLLLTLVFIIRMLDYVTSRKSWIVIGIALVFMIIAQFTEIHNLYVNKSPSNTPMVYFILVLCVSVLLSVGVFRIGNLLRKVKRSDERRLESENRFKLLFDHSGDEIFLADFDGNFIEINQEALRRLGYSREELMNKNFTDIKTPKFIPLVKKNIEIIRKNGHHIYETEHLTKGGAIKCLEMSSRVIDYFGRKAILSIARDITERKDIERKIAAAIIETEEKERKRFAADLHDGLAPLLSTIKLYTDLLKKGNFNKISQSETLQAVDELVDKAITSTREISNNIMPSILQDFGLPAAVKDFCNYINNTKSVHITLDTSQYQLTGPRIEETVLFQSIKELVNNSLKHSQARNIELFLESHKNQVNLFYKDDGIGFDVDEKLQQPAGLGLNNIINKVKTINGLAMIRSKKEEGMSVLITVNVKP